MPTNLPERPKPELDPVTATLFACLGLFIAISIVIVFAIGSVMVLGPPS